MLENELKAIWQSSPAKEQLKFEKSRLLIDVQSGLDRFNQSVRKRDLSEIGLSLILIPLLGWEAYKNPHMLSKVGAGLAVVWLIYVILTLLKLKRLRPEHFTTTYLDFLQKNRTYVKAQKRMRDTALYRYIIPSITSAVLFFVGMQKRPEQLAVALFIAGFVAFVVYRYNKKLIKEVYVPKLEKIENLITVLKEQ